MTQNRKSFNWWITAWIFARNLKSKGLKPKIKHYSNWLETGCAYEVIWNE